MRYLTFAFAGLIVLVACAADGIPDNPSLDPEPSGDSAVPPADAAPDDAGDGGVDGERPLVCGKTGFCETNIPTSDTGQPLSIRSVWVVTSNDVWSVSAEGFVLHYDGTTWTTAHRADHVLHSVWATATDVWAGGERGLLLHRTAGGAFTRVETGHIEDIRAIYGTRPDDVWFGRDGAIDRFDGSTMATHAIPGLHVGALFGRPGLGTYAVYVEGCIDCGESSESQPRLYELVPGQIVELNTAVRQRGNFFPTSGAVIEPDDASDGGDADGGPRVFLVGYEKVFYGWRFGYLTLQRETPPPLLIEPINDPYGTQLWVYDPKFETYPPPPHLPAWGKDDRDVRVQHAIGLGHRWNGTELAVMPAIDMGYSFVPGKVYAVHGNASDTWIVGDGFALKGPTQ